MAKDLAETQRKADGPSAPVKPTKPIAPLIEAWKVTYVDPKEVDSSKLEFSGVSYDSRTVEPGHVFFCIVGEKQDGNKFIPQAIELGAIAIVSEQDHAEPLPVPYIKVGDVRRAISETADYLYDRPSTRLRILGVTGTNGKTSTTHIVEHIFKTAGRKVGLIGTMGARWSEGEEDSGGYLDLHHTTPQAADLQRVLYEMVQRGVTHVAMEVSSHALALKRVDNCNFSAACLTNITQDHLDFHKTMENYWRSKMMLFTSLSGEESHAVLNADEELAEKFAQSLSKSVKLHTYGFSEKAEYRVEKFEFSKAGTSLRVATPQGELELTLRLLGHFNVYNALAAMVICVVEGIEPEFIKQGLATFKGVEGRFEVVHSGTPDSQEPLCIVDYAHTPDGLSNVLTVARQLVPENGKLIAVFGCGGDRDSSKRPQMGAIAEELADSVVVTSDNPRTEDPEQIIVDILAGIKRMKGVVVEADRATAIETAVCEASLNDVVVIAGKGHETYQILKDRVLDFDDRVEVRKALSKRSTTTTE